MTSCSTPPEALHRPYTALAHRFDAAAPGKGLDAYTPLVSTDHAMAYALVASAEAHWHARTYETRALTVARRAARWLVDNKDVDGDGLVGWGLSFAWDAFADGSTNPPNWPYTITTALAIQALLDVYDLSGEQELVDTAIEAAISFIERSFTRLGDEAWFHYSPAEHDHHSVYNVSAMMLGQLQRLTRHEPGFAEITKPVATHLINARRIDDAGRVHWMYSAPGAPSHDRENDLVHAAYVIQGLTDYARFGGELNVGQVSLYESLRAFIIQEGGISEMPHGEAVARDWGVGAALFTAALVEEETIVSGSLSNDFLEAALMYDPPDESFYPRQAAHVLLGLALTSP